MSSLAQSLVAWEEFLRLPERPETGQRYELHDGEVVIVPLARPLHIKLQKRIERLLEGGDPAVNERIDQAERSPITRAEACILQCPHAGQ